MTLNLNKGQTLSLSKSDGGTLSQARMALGWDAKTKKGFLGKVKEQDIDLDASALLFDASGQVVDTVYYGQLRSRDGSLVHTGDNLTGAGDGDDESINVNLSQVDSRVTQIVFTVNSYSGQSFSEVENAYCRVVDSASRDAELCRFTLTGGQDAQGMIMAKVSRVGNGWDFTAIGTPVARGRTVQALVADAQRAL